MTPYQKRIVAALVSHGGERESVALWKEIKGTNSQFYRTLYILKADRYAEVENQMDKALVGWRVPKMVRVTEKGREMCSI